ncbi:MAG: HD-GYP domain-containing protein [Methylophilaceae bacterium]|nr:HD-GYP domain-containing protein [Methylophilaceae bacterium]
MIKRIPTQQAKVGMYIEAFGGAWMDNPFWKKSLKLETDKDLQILLSSAIKQITIDTLKGSDVEVSIASVIDQDVFAKPTPEVVKSKISTADERVKAKKIISESKQAVASMFDDIRMGKTLDSEFATPFIEQISTSLDRNAGALLSLLSIKNKDDYTYMHSVAVCVLMIRLGRELKLSEAEIKHAGAAGLMHDLGKIKVSESILNKPGALNTEEFNHIKQHPELGHALLVKAQVLNPITLNVCLHHHEKVDGSGYPHQLKADDISIFAKMAAVCDVYDAVTSNRPYKAGWPPGVALQRMAQWTGHFDDAIFKAFVKCLGIYPVGSFVGLKSGRLGAVVDQGSNSLLTPIVKVFYSTKYNHYLPVEIIDLSKKNVKDEILGIEDPLLWGIHNVSEYLD